MNQREEQGKGRRQLLLLVALFAAPIVLAWLVFTNQSLITSKTKNHGVLVEPARPLPAFSLDNMAGGKTGLVDITKKWSLVYIGGAECNQDCVDSLYKMRQSRLGQKGEHGRINLVYVSAEGVPAESVKAQQQETPVLQVLSASQSEAGRLLGIFEIPGEPAAVTAGRVYMIDPQGNLMMFYRKGFEARGLAKDLELLLKISQVG